MDKALLRADLNLLKVLYVLLEERNVTRAAERLFVTQSAISRSLGRLRDMFNDPLLVRSSQGLVPTERANQIAAVVRETVEKMGGLFEPPPFDPRVAEGFIRIAAPESFVLAALPRLALAVRAAAPAVRIEALHLPDNHREQLEKGLLDFVINHDEPHPDTFLGSRLMSITPLFWFRKGHPLESHKEISLADICSYPIISFHAQNVSREVNRLIWQAIKDAGLPPPKILIDTSHLLVTLDILTMSDATMLGLEHLSQVPAFRDNLVSRPMEYVESVGRAESTLTLIQHERTAQSSVHLWISEMIRGVFRELSAEAA